jgi:ABC-type multidrug transport system fused ATPase/permease subunit
MDGVDIRRIALKALRSHIAMVPQDAFLFSGTIRENLCFGKEDASADEMARAARVAHFYDTIMEFGHQFDTVIGERGVTLSGGQKQRLALARALLISAPVLVLDDPLSQVDSETAGAILANVQELSADRTTVMVSHRISHVKDADLIIVLDRGHIEAVGTHGELMAREGFYKRMYQWQEIEKGFNNNAN